MVVSANDPDHAVTLFLVFPDAGSPDPAIRAEGFIPADEAAAIGAELRGLAGVCHMCAWMVVGLIFVSLQLTTPGLKKPEKA